MRLSVDRWLTSVYAACLPPRHSIHSWVCETAPQAQQAETRKVTPLPGRKPTVR
jgi:hypothetical protein